MAVDKFEAWRKKREMGFGRYVLISGVLSWGLPMFIAMTFFVHRQDLSAKFVAISAILWPVGGALFGVLTWWAQERQYRKHVGDA